MVDDGLSQNSVNCFAQDSLGFLWIGTSEGLNRYDGSTIKVFKYDPLDSSTLSTNSIKCLLAKGNKLWIGTYGGGLNCMDLYTGRIKKYNHDPKNEKSITGDFIYSIVEYENKFIIGTGDGGAGIFDPEKGTCTRLTAVAGNTIRGVCLDHKGNAWFASWDGQGVSMLNLKTNAAKHYHADGTKQGLNSERTRNVFVDSRGWIWVSCWASGYNVIEPSTGNVYSCRDTSFIKNLNIGLVSQFLEDSKGNIWFCSAEGGAIKYNFATGEREDFVNDVNDMYSMSDNTAFSVFEDKSHIIWIGTWRGGANMYDPKTTRFGWYRKDTKNPMPLINNNVYSLFPAKDGMTWVGTANGVCIFDPKKETFTPLPIDPNDKEALKPNSTIYCIGQDAQGRMWFGTSGGGIYSFDPSTKKFRLYEPSADLHSISSSSPSCVITDAKGRFFIGTYNNGLNRYDPATDNFTHYLPDTFNTASISGVGVSAMILRSDGKIWVGTSDGGLNIFDPDKGSFERFMNNAKDSNSIMDNSIASLCQDHHGRLWIGTSSGLCMYDPQLRKFFPYSRLHEYLKQEIVSIIEDGQGDLWLATRRGLCRFSPNENNALRFYDVSDGLQSNEFLYNGFYSPDGKICIGGYNGFNYFNAADIKDNTVLPNAVITSFSVLNHPYALPKDISYTKEITLNYSDYFFSFRFAAPEFSNTKKNMFRYKLEGFNTSWVDMGNNGAVTFTNLDPGEYTLLVEASNNCGIWNENATALKITITPPFWRTKWFYALCIAIIGFSAYSFVKWREKKLVMEKTVLEEKVEQRTTELRHEKEKVEAAHKDIKDSINYAKKIQTAILPQDEQFAKLLPGSFVLFKPKDIVSGDFYWITQSGEAVLYATADCTGHGVPGGFMTMLGTSLLNEIVNEKKISEPAAVLNELREKIISSLRQTGASGESKDGMDMVLCRIEKNKLTYAAANNSLYIIRNGLLKEYKPDKQPIGFYGDEKKPFTQHEIELMPGDMIFTFTDGYADQFGGEKGKKFKYRQLEDLLCDIYAKPLSEQKKILDTTIEKWKEGYDQVDDILIIGIQVGVNPERSV